MRVLHIYAGNMYGGIETFLGTLGRYQHGGSGVEHQFALCFEGRLSRELADAGATIHWLGRVRVSRPWTVWRARRALKEILRSEKYGVVVCHLSWTQAIFAPVARRAGLPVIYYLHGPLMEITWLDRWAALTRPQLMIGVSRHTAETGRQLFPSVPFEVLHYPIPREQVQADGTRAQVRSELGATADQAVILQASRMDAWKGHYQYLDALKLISDDPRWVCWMAGGAQLPEQVAYLEGLKTKARKLGLAERVRFLGERKDVPRLLAGADILCQANTGPEGFSLAFLEAFAAGVPIATTRLGGAPELIDDSSGILVPPGDVAGLAAGLRRLIADPELRRRMGQSATRRVRELCDPARQLGRLDQMMADLSSRGEWSSTRECTAN